MLFELFKLSLIIALYLLYLLSSFCCFVVVLCPAEVFGAGAEFEVVFCDAQVHLGVADEGEMALGHHAGQLPVLGREEFKGEFLLIDGGGGQ